MASINLPPQSHQPLINSAQLILQNPQVQQQLKSNPQLQQQLLQDPAGTILSNPSLRNAVLSDPNLSKEIGLNANATIESLQKNLSRLASDPEFQQKMRGYGVAGAEMAWQGIGNLGSNFKKYVEEGPEGIRLLCFFCGCFTFSIGAIGLLDVFQIIFSPFHFVINVYTVLFGITTMVVEADQERLSQLPFLEHVAPKLLECQKHFNEEAKFLTELLGRGVFYVFVGILMASECQLCLFFVAGVWNVVMGVMLVCLHFGIEPDLDYLQNHATAAYTTISSHSIDTREFPDTHAAWENHNSSKVRNDKLLKALSKQAILSDAIESERPTGVFNASAKADFDAHLNLKGMSKDDAKREFVNRCNMRGIGVGAHRH